MHMNSAPHLLNEDRPEFERILDEALRTAPDRPDLAAVGQRLNPEQLRTMALNATALITAAAATEYQNYVKVRADLRASPRPVRPLHEEGNAAETGGGAIGLAATVGEVAETTGSRRHSRRRGPRPRTRRDGCRDLPARRLHPEDARSGTGFRPDLVDGRLGVRRAHGSGHSCRRRGPAAHRSAQWRDVLAGRRAQRSRTRRWTGPEKPGAWCSWNAASCPSSGKPSRNHHAAPANRGSVPDPRAACRISGTTGQGSAARAPTAAPLRPRARRTRARTSRAPTSEARTTSRTRVFRLDRARPS